MTNDRTGSGERLREAVADDRGQLAPDGRLLVLVAGRRGPTLRTPLPPVAGDLEPAKGAVDGVDQNAASETSMSALSMASAMARRADSSGKTVWAKNRATAALPS